MAGSWPTEVSARRRPRAVGAEAAGVQAGVSALRQTARSIEFVVASVASRIKIPGFLVEEMAESRKSIHILYSSISITDTEVGARGQPLLWNRK